MSRKQISGTLEWAAHNANLPQTGCEHNCRYCYARAMAVRFGRTTPDKWKTPKPTPVKWSKFEKRYDGTVMFPTTHDITPENIELCVDALKLLVGAGNRVLIVSKPHIYWAGGGASSQVRPTAERRSLQPTIGARKGSFQRDH